MTEEEAQQQVERLREAFPEEDLHDDLAPWIEQGDTFPMLRHPLVYSVPYFPGMNHHLNRLYEHKTSSLTRASESGDWDTYVFLHERPWRISAFVTIQDRIDDSTYWQLLSSIWTDSENIRQNPEVWEALLGSDRPRRANLMNPTEQLALDALPETITVYQGHTDERSDGWSWTTDREVAIWFANRFAGMERAEPRVTTATVPKDAVLAYLLGRNEQEILVSPEDVTITSTKPVTAL